MPQKNEQNGTCVPPDSYEQFIREWVVTFAENASKEVSPALVSLWVRAFRGIPRESLLAAFQETIRTWRITQMPPVGEILSHIAAAEKVLEDLDAEEAWQRALTLAKDLGNDYSVESVREPDDETLLSAVRAAGGWRYLAQCSEKELVWAKKAFIEQYARKQKEPYALALAGSEPRKLLRAITEKKAIGE
jgi:hypothetical protein